ncbi:MAG: DUF502 domain-containing protein [Candidatus Omnitrophota bacterium]
MWHNLRKYFISGLLAFLPLALTVYLFIWTIWFADGLLGKYIQPLLMKFLGFYIPGLGLIAAVLMIILIGVVATRFFGGRIQMMIDKLALRLPFFKQVYPAFKEIANFFFSRNRLSFRQVVIIEYPRKGIYSFGFLTNESSERLKKLTREDICNVFISSSPSPLTGFVIMVPKKDIIETDLTVEEAAKFVVSGGVVNPNKPV